MAEDVITGANRIQFPTKPGLHQTYPDMPTRVTVERRWVRISHNLNQYDILWMSNCVGCNTTMWAKLDEAVGPSLTEYLNSTAIATQVEDPERPGTFYRCCMYCNARDGRKALVLTTGRHAMDNDNAADCEPIVWPDAVFAEMRKREAELRLEQQKWIEARPMAPEEGALVYLREQKAITYFEGWTEDGLARVKDGDAVPAEQMFTLIPAIFGVMHDNLVSLPKEAFDGVKKRANELFAGLGQPVESVAVRWSYGGHHHMVTGRDGDGKTVSYSADGVACFVPSVNPAVEKPKDGLLRLQYSLDRHKYAMHQRLVAEGKQRGWCETFDPILVSQGMDPRSGRVIVTGTAHFTYAVNDGDWSEEIMSNVQSGKSVLSYVPNEAFTFDEVKVEKPEKSRLLS